ncbi:shikimate dehydrogenase [Catenulispora sp. EB89]|uniref:shikimate dehydrogenase n=1 Tax=Catenulispora sp. EB89 TaxID=3156257 RepID=UPI0035179EDB
MTRPAPLRSEDLRSEEPDLIRHAAVLGSPIAHSLSPVLHRAAYTALGLTDWTYDAHDVDEASLPDFLSGLDASWAGLSLTMPLKRAVIPLLDEVSATARAVEAVNTVLFAADGSRTGTNTDVPGLVNALAERAVTEAASAAVLGAGATASSALSALSGIAKSEVEVFIRNRARDAEIHAIAEAVGTPIRIRDWKDAPAAFEHELVISTTPTGATDDLAQAVPPTPGTLFDVLYHPWPTPLAAAWTAHGGAVLGGLDLLVHQAVLQVELMTGRAPAPLAAMRVAGEAALSAR